MKVGTDGVLLGAWASTAGECRRALDIGTGTGLIALMLAQRLPEVLITGVDVDDISQASQNASASPWASRLGFEQCPVQEFRPDERFGLIVSNPPFFADSLTCPDRGRTTARHTVQLPFEELRDAAVRLLAPEGRFAVVLPTTEGERFTALCRDTLTLSRRTEVRTTPRHAPKRLLLEFMHASSAPASPQTAELTIGTGAHEEYTPEYRALTCDFYLKF